MEAHPGCQRAGGCNTIPTNVRPVRQSAAGKGVRSTAGHSGTAWHLTDQDARERFADGLPEFEDVYDLLTDFPAPGGYRILETLVCDMGG